MVAENNMDAMAWLRKHLADDSDLMREMVATFVRALMSAEADALCGAGYRERSPERVNARNGCRSRDFDTRVGSMELEIPKLRERRSHHRRRGGPITGARTAPCRWRNSPQGGPMQLAGDTTLDYFSNENSIRTIALTPATVDLIRQQRTRLAEPALAAGTKLVPDACVFPLSTMELEKF